MSLSNIVVVAKAINADLAQSIGAPEEGLSAKSQQVVMGSLVRGSRGYIEAIANQINGAYENGWYDACAVMIRRLIETLIIETFEKHQIAEQIKNPSGDFFYLRDLIAKTLEQKTWNPSRNLKNALPKLKDIGDKSAHNRFFLAKRGDIQPLLADIRTVVQELMFQSDLKK